MSVTIAGGLELHYEIAGAEGEPLLLINGVGDDLGAWAGQVAAFTAAGLRVVTFDNRGVGRSGGPPGPYLSGEMAADTKAVADAAGIGPYHVVGVSMGGLIAQEFALAYPDDVRSVVLANTYARPDAFTRAAFAAWAEVAQVGGMAMLGRQQAPWIFSPAFYERDPATVARMLAEMQTSPQAPARFADQIDVLLTHDALPRLGELRAPALVIAAADDIIIRPSLSRQLLAAVPRAAWVTVAGGHAAFWEDPAPWNQAILDFIAQWKGVRP